MLSGILGLRANVIEEHSAISKRVEITSLCRVLGLVYLLACDHGTEIVQMNKINGEKVNGDTDEPFIWIFTDMISCRASTIHFEVDATFGCDLAQDGFADG